MKKLYIFLSIIPFIHLSLYNTRSLLENLNNALKTYRINVRTYEKACLDTHRTRQEKSKLKTQIVAARAAIFEPTHAIAQLASTDPEMAWSILIHAVHGYKKDNKLLAEFLACNPLRALNEKSQSYVIHRLIVCPEIEKINVHEKKGAKQRRKRR